MLEDKYIFKLYYGFHQLTKILYLKTHYYLGTKSIFSSSSVCFMFTYIITSLQAKKTFSAWCQISNRQSSYLKERLWAVSMIMTNFNLAIHLEAEKMCILFRKRLNVPNNNLFVLTSELHWDTFCWLGFGVPSLRVKLFLFSNETMNFV